MRVDRKQAFLQNELSAEGSDPRPAPVGAHGDAPSARSRAKRRGPNTEKGKAPPSRNALKHGIMSPHPVIIEGMETEEDWNLFLREIVESQAPEGRFEEELAERIAFFLWRLRRCGHHETAVLNHQVLRTAQDRWITGVNLH